MEREMKFVYIGICSNNIFIYRTVELFAIAIVCIYKLIPILSKKKNFPLNI